MDAKATATVLEQYLEIYPEERDGLQALIEQCARGDNLNDRKRLPGHGTGAAIILSPDCDEVLLVHHAFLDRWLQPGGHWDPGESDPLAAARREAVEETGVRLARYVPLLPSSPLVPLQIDIHHIPANDKKGEPEHDHYDFRYGFVAASKRTEHDAVEVRQVGWYALDDQRAAEVRVALQRLQSLL
jgi:8-oxo-dGTP pyrophosphatase MutT (NUDIX family)